MQGWRRGRRAPGAHHAGEQVLCRVGGEGLGHQARTTQVSRLSQSPCAALASVLADSGASTSASAQRRSSMCSTSSPTRCHCRHSAASPAYDRMLVAVEQGINPMAHCPLFVLPLPSHIFSTDQ